MKPKRKKIGATPTTQATTMDQEKFDMLSRVFLQILGAKGMRWGDLVDQAQARLPHFKGSLPHSTLPCLRELVTQGKVIREPGPPPLYLKKMKRKSKLKKKS